VSWRGPALEKAAREKAKGATDQVQSRGKAMREDVAGKLAEAKGKGAQQRMAVHMKRIAQLNRLRELAQQKGDQNMIARVDKLIAQENQVYDRKLGKMQGPNRAGGAMPRMNPPGAKGKADVNQPTQVKPPAQTPPAPVQEKAGEAAQPPAGQSNQPKP
jgi:hypothetical protein